MRPSTDRTTRQPSGSANNCTDAELTLTDQAPLNPALTINANDCTPSEIWRTIARSDVFQNDLIDWVLDLLGGHHPDEAHDVLNEAGVSALDGRYQDWCIDAANGHKDRMWNLLRATSDLGQPRSKQVELGPGLDTSLGAVGDGPLAILRASPPGRVRADGHTPTIVVAMGQGFLDRRREQRKDVCSILAGIARAYDLRVVASSLTQQKIRREHHGDLPGVSERRNDSPPTGVLDKIVERARDTLDSEGREANVLRGLVDDPIQTLTYGALANGNSVSRSRIRQCIKSLRDLGLVDSYSGPEEHAAELLEPGREFVEDLDCKIGRQQDLGNPFQGDVNQTPKAHANRRVTSPTRTAPSSGESTGLAGRPADESAAVADEAPTGGVNGGCQWWVTIRCEVVKPP